MGRKESTLTNKPCQIKKIRVFWVTRPYLNLQVKPSFLSVFWKKIFLCILKGKLPFKMHKIIFFPEKETIKKMCANPTKNFQTCFPKHTYLFFVWPLLNRVPRLQLCGSAEVKFQWSYRNPHWSSLQFAFSTSLDHLSQLISGLM